MTTYTVSVNNNQYTLNTTAQDVNLSLSRTGGQGTKGDSITNAYIDSNNDFIIEISNASGTVVQTVNVGGGTITGNLNAFDAIYLGAKTSAPTLDNLSNALIDGALFFNTTTNELGVYDLGTTTWEYPALEAATSASASATSATLATTKASEANASADAAAVSETNAATSETNAATSATNSATSATASAGSATNSAASATAASTSETNAAASETSAANQAGSATNSAAAAATSETNAATSETNAATSETNAATSESNASTSETNAAASETNAANSATAAANSASSVLTSETNAATSATNAASSATASANSATAAATSETNAATSETNAATSETNAATSATNAATSETNAATSETNASNSASAASTSETNAATSATNAASSALAAATSETNAATSETNAATSATNASTSETNAATSATNAGNSETNASNSASAASTSEVNAATSAASAATSLASVETIFDNFDDRFLGTKTSDPTVDNDGNALATGSFYYNSTTNELKVYNGTSWIAPSTSASNSASAAASSATASASSATAAAASETNVENLYDAFDDLFLGPKSSAPTLDNDGDALQTGAIYYDTTASVVYFYNGTSWDVPGLSEENIEDIVDGLLQEGLGVTLTYDDTANTLTVDVDAIEENVKNVSGGTLSAGTVVYQSGSTGTIAEVQAADHTSGSTMPALGILSEDIASGAEGKLVLIGKVSGLNTSSFSAGATVYVGTSGALQATAPTGEANYIQNIGKVLKVHSTNGSMLVTGAGRTNATPNLDDRQFFIGNTSNESTTSDFDQEVTDIALALSIALG
jgi:hypothetical protein